MPISSINNVRLYWEQQGTAGAPVVLVHGSWGDHHNWDGVVGALARTLRAYTYDRRGHNQSERPAGQGHIEEDVADLAAFIRAQGIEPAHIVGNSFGAAVALKLAASQPSLLASLTVHEPPLLAMLGDHPMLPAVGQRIEGVMQLLRAGEMEAGAERFVETVALGPGMWRQLPPEMRETFVWNAPTFLDEINEGLEVMAVDLAKLAAFDRPALVTRGDQSPPFFSVILEQIARALPHAQRYTFVGGGHVPHVTHPQQFVELVSRFIASAAAPRSA